MDYAFSKLYLVTGTALMKKKIIFLKIHKKIRLDSLLTEWKMTQNHFRVAGIAATGHFLRKLNSVVFVYRARIIQLVVGKVTILCIFLTVWTDFWMWYAIRVVTFCNIWFPWCCMCLVERYDSWRGPEVTTIRRVAEAHTAAVLQPHCNWPRSTEPIWTVLARSQP